MASAWAALLGCNLLERELGNAGALGCVFDSDGANVAMGVYVERGVLIEVACFRDRYVLELDEQGVGVLEVADSHGSNLRSKNAL